MGSHRRAGILNERSRTANFMLNGNTCKISLSHWHTEALDVHVRYSRESLDAPAWPVHPHTLALTIRESSAFSSAFAFSVISFCYV